MTVSPFRLLTAMAMFALLPPTGMACVQEPPAAPGSTRDRGDRGRPGGNRRRTPQPHL